MNYQIGQKLRYLPDSKFEEPVIVEVVRLQKRGAAKLSNGWVADDDGIVEGSGRIPGGRVVLLDGE